MPIQFPLTVYLPPTNVEMRLTAEETKFLKSRIEDAMADGKGVNLIIHNLRGAVCIVRTEERGYQLAFTAHAHSLSYTVKSRQKGYGGEWCHVEFHTDAEGGVSGLKKFLTELQGKQALQAQKSNPTEKEE